MRSSWGRNDRAAAAARRRREFYAAAPQRPYLPAEQIPGSPFVHLDGARRAPSVGRADRRPDRVPPWRSAPRSTRDSGVPVGVLGDAGAHDAALALPRPARLAARDDRPARRRPTRSRRAATRPRARPPARAASATATGCRSPRRRARGWSRPAAPAGPSSRRASRTRAASSRSSGRSRSPGSTRRCCSTRTTRSRPRSRSVEGIDAAAIVAALDSPEVTEAYEADKAQARSAAGGATEFQGKAAVSDGLVRFTAPSVVFEADGRRPRGRRLPAARGLRRAASPTSTRRSSGASARRTDPRELLAHFPEGLCTQEVAVLLAGNLVDVDRAAAEDALLALLAEGARRAPRSATTRSGAPPERARRPRGAGGADRSVDRRVLGHPREQRVAAALARAARSTTAACCRPARARRARAGRRSSPRRRSSSSSWPGPQPECPAKTRARRTPAASSSRSQSALGKPTVPNTVSAASDGSRKSASTTADSGATGPPRCSVEPGSASASSAGETSASGTSSGRLRISPSAPSSSCAATSTTVRDEVAGRQHRRRDQQLAAQRFHRAQRYPGRARRGVHRPAGRAAPLGSAAR